MERDEDLIRVAGAVSDGEQVDWDKEIAARPDLEEVFKNLREMQSVTALFSALCEEVETDPELLKVLAKPE
jgi:hypothetical protein